MPKLRKLKVTALRKHEDSIHTFLCKLGVTQYITIDCNDDTYSGMLQVCPIPDASADINLDFQLRIKKICDKFNFELEEEIDTADSLPGNTVDELLSYIEEHLVKIEEDLAGFEEEIASNKVDADNQDEVPDGDSSIEDHPDKDSPIEDHPEFNKIRSNLSKLNELTKSVAILIETRSSMTHMDTIVYFEIWVIEESVPEVKEGILNLTDGKSVIVDEKAQIEDNEPIFVKESSLLFEGFSSLTQSLGLPRKGEINPTTLVIFTFPFLFGIMFADVGQGAILLLLGLFLLNKRRKADFTKIGQIYTYLLRAAGGMVLCGISAIFFGFLFGEFFGPSGVLHPILLFEIGPFKFGGFDPLHEPITLLRFSILLGVSFITVSLILSFINHLIRREFAHGFSVICWIWFLIGGFTMWVYWGGISKITVWFGEGLLSFAALIIAPLVLMFLINGLSEGFMMGFNHTIEVSIETLSHTLSFCRIAALFLTHTAINTMFLQLGGVSHGYFPLLSIPYIAVGTILNLTIEALLVTIHVLRLHWIELLPKFYSGKGKPFKPIKI